MELTKSYQKLAETYLGNSSGNLYIRIYAKYNSQSVENNTSNVSYQSRLYFSGSYIISQGQTKVEMRGTSISNTTTSWQNFEGRQDGRFNNGETIVKTITTTINHNSDGTGSINASAIFSSTGSWGWSGTASGTATLPNLHTPPELSLSSVAENSSKLSGIDGTTFVNNISEKTFTLNYTMYDSATASSLKIYDKNGNELSATTSLGSSSGTIAVNFKNTPINSTAITNNKTTFTIKLTDSLNGVTTITTSEYTVIPYFAPNLITTASNVKRNGQTTGKAILNLTGQFYNATIGNTTNAITLSFAYWTGSTESSTYYPITIDGTVVKVSGNNITANKYEFKKNNSPVTDLDKANSYKFKIKAVDSFGSEYESIIELTLAKGEWLMAKFKDRIDFKKITIDGYNPFEYSDEETVVGVWVENDEEKPIYRKVFEGTSNIGDGVSIDLANLNADIIFNVYGWVKSSYGQWWPIKNHYPPDSHYDTSTNYTYNNKLNVHCESYYSYPEYRIILEYTKTTD